MEELQEEISVYLWIPLNRADLIQMESLNEPRI